MTFQPFNIRGWRVIECLRLVIISVRYKWGFPEGNNMPAECSLSGNNSVAARWLQSGNLLSAPYYNA